MLLASHQPYFFPYLGYFSLISAVDNFIFFDITQFNRKSWMTRNRILKPNKPEFQFIKAGIKQPPFKALLHECKLSCDQQWKTKLMAQLEHYKKKAPYYNEVMLFLSQLLVIEEDLLVDFNVRSTIAIAQQLKIETQLFQYSKIEHRIEKASYGSYWGLNFCKAFGADTYLNAPGGEKLYSGEAYKAAGIKLGFIQHKLYPYVQNNKNNTFIPGLSIIDVLMFNGFEGTSEMIRDYSIKWM